MEVRTIQRLSRLRLIALGFAGAAFGSAAQAAVDTETLDAATLPPYERVESIPALGGLRGFNPVDEETLILWATHHDPYLVKLAYPSPELKWARAVGVESATSLIHERFDAVRIDGLRYPIREIYKLSRDQARELDRRS